MFGFVTANFKELDKEQRLRYRSIYCGICTQIRENASPICRLALSYDMAFLATLYMSLYEPEETVSESRCALHPVKPRQKVDNPYIRYAADMNVALAYFNAADDWQDDQKRSAKWKMQIFGKRYPEIAQRYPRQCEAIAACLEKLSALERENCDNADETANCFGALMAELLVYEEDLWAPTLRKMGMALGRFIYLADAAVDYRKDQKNGKYNPLAAMQTGEDWPRWENYLVMAMGCCTEAFEKLPLVQDKKLLDNILYSGVWCNFRGKKKKVREEAQ